MTLNAFLGRCRRIAYIDGETNSAIRHCVVIRSHPQPVSDLVGSKWHSINGVCLESLRAADTAEHAMPTHTPGNKNTYLLIEFQRWCCCGIAKKGDPPNVSSHFRSAHGKTKRQTQNFKCNFGGSRKTAIQSKRPHVLISSLPTAYIRRRYRRIRRLVSI